MKKTVTAILIMALLTALSVGCGGGSDKVDSGDSESFAESSAAPALESSESECVSTETQESSEPSTVAAPEFTNTFSLIGRWETQEDKGFKHMEFAEDDEFILVGKTTNMVGYFEIVSGDKKGGEIYCYLNGSALSIQADFSVTDDGNEMEYAGVRYTRVYTNTGRLIDDPDPDGKVTIVGEWEAKGEEPSFQTVKFTQEQKFVFSETSESKPIAGDYEITMGNVKYGYIICHIDGSDLTIEGRFNVGEDGAVLTFGGERFERR